MTNRADLDIDLIDRYLSGDVDAFNELMAAHEDRVFAVCLRMLRDRQAALDATQETFLTVFRKADRYRAQAAFSTWLHRVAINTCYDHLRREKRRGAASIPDHYDEPDRTAGDEFEAVDVRGDIADALAELNPEYRAAVVLVDLQGLSLDQAAEGLDVPTGTVKSRLFRGRKQLAQKLGNLRDVSEHPTGDQEDT